MHYSASRVKQEYGVTGILYDLGSVYEGLSKITDKRKARGKLYRLEMILMIIVLAKLSGEDKPSGIAERGKTSWGGDREIDAIEEITDAKREHLSTDTCRSSVSGRGGTKGREI
jgi:DDE_Tnp_1-associated